MNLLNSAMSGLLILSTLLGLPTGQAVDSSMQIVISKTDIVPDTMNVEYVTLDRDTSADADADGVYTASIMAVGDNLIHTPVYESAKQADGTYDFTSIFENLYDQIQGADISVINQETILIDDRSRISSYPTFGTPIEMSDAISAAGFNVVLHATNHTMDKGTQGVRDTLSVWHNYFPEMTVLGIHSSQEDADEIQYLEKNNIKFALLNYTYGTNGLSIPSDQPYLVDTLYDRDKVIADVDRAEHTADVTICFLHIGEEYRYTPTTYQREYIEDLIDYGADIIICAHPHVLEPYEIVTTDLNNSAVVYYSLGNFMSGQNQTPRLLGGMANVTVQKTVQNGVSSVKITDYSMTALVTHQEAGNYTVYRLCDYDDGMARKNAQYSKDPTHFNCDYLWNLYLRILDGTA